MTCSIDVIRRLRAVPEHEPVFVRFRRATRPRLDPVSTTRRWSIHATAAHDVRHANSAVPARNSDTVRSTDCAAHSSAARTPAPGSAGTDGTLKTLMEPTGDTATRSVNVPPMSTPMRQPFAREAEGVSIAGSVTVPRGAEDRDAV